MKKIKWIYIILLLLFSGCFGLVEEKKNEEIEKTLFQKRIINFEITEEYVSSMGGLKTTTYSAVFDYDNISEIRIYLSRNIENEIGIVPTLINKKRAEYDKNLMLLEKQKVIYIYIKDDFGENYLKEYQL